MTYATGAVFWDMLVTAVLCDALDVHVPGVVSTPDLGVRSACRRCGRILDL